MHSGIRSIGLRSQARTRPRKGFLFSRRLANGDYVLARSSAGLCLVDRQGAYFGGNAAARTRVSRSTSRVIERVPSRRTPRNELGGESNGPSPPADATERAMERHRPRPEEEDRCTVPDSVEAPGDHRIWRPTRSRRKWSPFSIRDGKDDQAADDGSKIRPRIRRLHHEDSDGEGSARRDHSENTALEVHGVSQTRLA
jgi:hypothetical protein